MSAFQALLIISLICEIEFRLKCIYISIIYIYKILFFLFFFDVKRVFVLFLVHYMCICIICCELRFAVFSHSQRAMHKIQS